MLKIALAAVGFVVSVTALAEDGAVKMSKEELLSFLPGVKVTQIASSGSERHWTNEPGGKIYMNTNNKLYGSAMGTQTASHEGTWSVNDEGKYCIDVDWKRIRENWCANVLKAQDNYYLNVADEKHKIVFAK